MLLTEIGSSLNQTSVPKLRLSQILDTHCIKKQFWKNTEKKKKSL